MRSKTHTHDCANRVFGCLNKIECFDVFLERNYDGWPEIVCSFFKIVDPLCEDCEDADSCEYCGTPEHLAHDLDCEFWSRELPTGEIPIEAYIEFDNFDERMESRVM